MTKEELKDYYKVINIEKIDNEKLIKVDLHHAEGDPNRHIRLLFIYNKLYYTGDMGTYVFGKSICDIKTFFRGREIEPSYWSEKVEAFSEPLLDENIDSELAEKEVCKFLQNNYEEYFTDRTLKEYTEEVADIISDCFYDWEENKIRAYDNLCDMFTELNVENPNECACDIIGYCQKYNCRYLYACEVIQWVENEILEDTND